ncbi:MAG: AAA family ATPase [Clostridia bacterium]|jgi:hypothetical protein
MKRIRLQIELSDKEFANRLSQYIKINGLNIFNIINDKPDAVLHDCMKDNNDEYIMLNTNNKETSIYRYQSADRIMGSIMECMDDIDVVLDMKLKSNNKTIFVTSAHGGAGKTYISSALAIYLARKGKKVLHINLDGLCVNDSLFECDDEKDISLIIYYANKNIGNINTYIERYKNFDAGKNVYFIKSIYPSFETLLSLSSAMTFIESLNSNSLYDYIICDCPLYPVEHYTFMMKNAFKTLFVKCRGSEREEEVTTFLKKNEIDILCLCNMIRYTEGIYIPKAEEDIKYNPSSFYESIEQIAYELEKGNGTGL